MNKIQPLTEEFIKSLCDTYKAADPVFTEVLQEQRMLKIQIAMLRGAFEASGEKGSQPFIEMFTVLLSHFDKVTGIIAAHQGLAMSVNAVMQEHQEVE